MAKKLRYAIVAQLAGFPCDTHVIMETCHNLPEVREKLKALLSNEDWQDTTRIWEYSGIERWRIAKCPESATPESCLSVAYWHDGPNSENVNWLYIMGYETNEESWLRWYVNPVPEDTMIWYEHSRWKQLRF